MTKANLTERPGRVLVVDDDQMTRELMFHLLKRYYVVDLAQNAKAALECLQRENYDVLLLDIMMPGMSGLQLLEHLRKSEEYASVPVILVSAMGSTDDVVRGLERGANDYIVKPTDTSIILARVRTQVMLKRLMDERQRTIEQLDQLDQIRTRLFQIASHDLKNPLNNIHMAEHLLRQMVDMSDETVVNILDNLHNSAELMQEILESFLDVVAIQTGFIELRPQELRLQDVIDTVLMQYEASANHKGINLLVDVSQASAIADPKRLEQILGNLISNAIKYSPPNSEIHVWIEDRADCVRLCVRDFGPGVAESERSRLFKEFSRTSNKPSAGESSTGLGLWIVRQLTLRLGGDAGADFPEEGGSVFWVQFPAAVVPVMKYAQTAS